MAICNIAVIVVFIAMAHAYGFGGQDPWAQFGMQGFFAPMVPTPPFLPFRPFPPSAIKIPTPADIASIQPGPNQYVNGISVQSSISYSRDAQGNVIETGGATVLTNENGRLNIHTVGKNPPKVKRVIEPPTPQN